MSTSRRHDGSRLSRRSLLGGAAAAVGSFGFPAIVKAQAETLRAGHLTPRTGFLGLKEVGLPTIPPGQIVGLMRNAMGSVRYSSGGQNLNQLRAQSGSNDFFNGAGGVLDTDRDVYTVGIPGGDGDGADNGWYEADIVNTQLWSLARPATLNLIPYNQGGHLPAGADGASVCQGTVGLVGTLADGVTGDVALTDVSQFAATGGLALLCVVDVGGPILPRQEIIRYDSRNSGAKTKTIHVTARHVMGGSYTHTGNYTAGDSVTPFGDDARPGSLRVYTDTLGLYGPVNDPFPASNHTYGALTYMPSVKRFWWQTSAKWFQGSAYPENGEYDPATHRFTYNARDPNNDWYPGAASTWDTTQRRCIFNGGFNLYAYDPAKPGGQKISIVRALPGSDTNQVHRSLYDPRRRRVVYCGVKRNATWSVPGISYCRIRQDGTGDPFVDLPGNPTAVLAARGAPIGGPGPDIPGWLYHPVLDKYVYYHGAGNTFYYIDPDTGVVTSETFVGPALSNTVGTGGAGWFLQYSPAQDIMILPKIDAGMMGPLPNGQLYGLRSVLSGRRA